MRSGSDDTDVRKPGSDAGDVTANGSSDSKPEKGRQEWSDGGAVPKKGKKAMLSESDDFPKPQPKKKRTNCNDFPIERDERLGNRRLLADLNERYSIYNVLNVLKYKK
jgi:hypothetical protein